MHLLFIILLLTLLDFKLLINWLVLGLRDLEARSTLSIPSVVAEEVLHREGTSPWVECHNLRELHVR